jgi:antitoxin VapB
MPLNIKHPDADRLARELARRRQRSITDVVIEALEAELTRERRRVRTTGLADRLNAISERYAALPTRDKRGDEEILGYDKNGLPT